MSELEHTTVFAGVDSRSEATLPNWYERWVDTDDPTTFSPSIRVDWRSRSTIYMSPWLVAHHGMARLVVVCVCVVVLFGPLTAFAPPGITHHVGSPGTDQANNQLPAGSASETARPANNTTQAEPEPGAQFIGAIGAHREQHEGAVTEHRVDVRLSRADSPEAKAQLVASIHHQNERRLEELADRKRELRQAYENGSISASEYRARSAVLDVELRSVERTAIQLERVADDLSTSLLIEVGVELAAIREVQTRAHELQGTALAVIAPSFTRGQNATETDSPTPADFERAFGARIAGP